MSNWLEDTLNSITGVSHNNAINLQQLQQQQFQQQYLANQAAIAAAQNNPALSEQRTKQVKYAIIGIVVVVILLKIFKVF